MKLRLDPHRTLSKRDWKPRAWEVLIPGREPLTMAGYIEDFDHNLRFAFRYSVELDREAIFRAAGLPDDAVVAAYATVDCQQSGVRLSASTDLTDD